LQQVIVANADQVLIVGLVREPPVWLELRRYLIAAAGTTCQPHLYQQS